MTIATRRRGGLPGPTVLALVLVVVGIAGGVVLALAQPRSTAPTPTVPAGSVDVASLGAPATGTPGPAVSGSAVSGSASDVPSAAPTGSVPIDPSLLDVLPATVKDLPLVENADGEASAVSDPGLASQASGLAAALVIDPVTGDFAYVSVVRLRPGVFSDAYFRSWRDTFDSGACVQAGGVAQSSAEATLNGHETFIGHCVGGILTYHVHLVPDDLLVSISSVGTLHFGQLVVEGLR